MQQCTIDRPNETHQKQTIDLPNQTHQKQTNDSQAHTIPQFKFGQYYLAVASFPASKINKIINIFVNVARYYAFNLCKR